MADWKKTEQLYEGKAKKVYATENPEVVIVDIRMTQLHSTAKRRVRLLARALSTTVCPTTS